MPKIQLRAATIVGTQKLTEEYLTADGKTLKVTVTYDEKAEIPENAKLKVKEIQAGDKGWGDRSARLAGILSKEYGNVTLSDVRYLSISILVGGGEYEPKAPVQVDIEYKKALSTKDTAEACYDELTGEMVEPAARNSRFAAIHYTGEGAEIIDASNTSGQDGITATQYTVDGFSDYDLVYMYDYETVDAGTANYDPSTGTKKAEDIMKALNTADSKASESKAGSTRGAGDEPQHGKTLTDNQNGTYTIGLSVTGDADTESNHASNANVIIIYDVSSSMIAPYNYVPMETGGRGLDTTQNHTSYQDGNYFELYRRNGNSYSLIGNDNYTGTVYRRTGNGGWGQNYTYTEYTGQRYSYNIDRAAASEKVVYDFTNALFGYQNADDPTNIQAAFITFSGSATNVTNGWTSNKNAILNRVSSNGTSHSLNYSNYTNWTAALQTAENLLNSSATDDDPTYVVFITDGRPQTSSQSEARPNYNSSKVIAQRIEAACDETNGAFYGIFAFANDDDWLASLLYYAYNNQDPPASDLGETFDTEGYYKASDTAALTHAIDDIFQKIVQTLGVTEVSIADGTTSRVETSTGVAHLLEVNEDSYQYWMTIPVTAGQGGTYSFAMPDKTTGDPITYTVTPDGDNVTITWKDKDGNNKSASYAGSVNLNQLTIEWDKSTDFYKFTPPTASHNASTGSVDWNLHSVGTLLDGVTYTVTFECYPSQDTLDLIADLKNGDIEYDELDQAVQQYLTEDYKLRTNTTATLVYTDTRTNNGQQSVEYDNPDPEPVNATEQIAVSKTWNNTLDSREGWKQNLKLYVLRDNDQGHEVELTQDNNWTNTAWISYGILTTKDDVVTLKTTGHEYTFSEEVQEGYYWVIKAPTVRPMLIDNVVTMLKVLDESEAPAAIKGITEDNARTEADGETYYKLTINDETKYYVVIDDASAALTAINHRRSYLDVVKTVQGDNAPAGDEFEFNITVVNGNAETSADDDINSDAWVWFSIADSKNNYSMVKDPDIVSATGLRWQLNDDSVVTSKPSESDFNGYFCVPSGTEITVNMQDGYSLRFLNLPEGTTYTVSESETMPADGYSFLTITGERGFDESGEIEYQLDDEGKPVIGEDGKPISINDDWTTEDTGTVDGQSISGTIEYVESAYKVEVTNKWETIDIQLKKVDESGADLSGATFELYRGDELIDTYSPAGSAVDLGGLGIGTYTLKETEAPENYETVEDITFVVYKDGTSLKARLNGTRNDVTISGEQGTGGMTYTLTVTDKMKTATVIITKNVTGLDGDQEKEFEFKITGISDNEITKALVGKTDSEDHSVTYENVPYGTAVTVTETADGLFTTQYTVNDGDAVSGNSVTFTVSEDTVNEDGEIEIVFTNTRSKQLIRVFKYELGSNPEEPLEGAEFSLTGSDASGISYTGVTTGEDGYLVCDSKTLIEVPVDTAGYTLSETDPPEGYTALSEDVKLTVIAGGVTVTGANASVQEDTVDGETVYTIKIGNSTGTALPATGGTGTAVFAACGWMLVILSLSLAGIAVMIKRRKTNA